MDRRRNSLSGDTRPYLSETARVRVRFHEVDSMQIVWHGHYVSYFEEGRRAFGRRYGTDYTVFTDYRIGTPVVSLWVEYLSPARVKDELDVEARLYKTDSARIEFGYWIRRVGDGALLATGGSVQVFTTLEGELLPTWPAMMRERLESWSKQWIKPA